MTLEKFFKKQKINISQYRHLNNIKSVSYKTILNILSWKHDWEKYNKKYRWKLPYFPTERTISKLSIELWITYVELENMIRNQHKNNKKTW